MKLIGAGLPRTATLSRENCPGDARDGALLPHGKRPQRPRSHTAVDRSVRGDRQLEEIFEGFQATVDWPGAFFYEELMEGYPDAKVLLSVREGDAWARSIRNTIWGVLSGDTMMHDLSSARGRIDPGWHSFIELVTAMRQKSGLLSSAEEDLGTGEIGESHGALQRKGHPNGAARATARVVSRRRLGSSV